MYERRFCGIIRKVLWDLTICQLTRVETCELAMVTRYGQTGLVLVENASGEPVSAARDADKQHWASAIRRWYRY